MLHGDSYSDAYRYAMKLKRKRGLTFVHPYDDPDVIAGQGTIGMEILRQTTRPIHAVFVAVGGGGLIAGIAAYIKRLRPSVRVIGVEPVDADAMTRSLKAGRRVVLDHVGLFADGVAVKQVGKETFRLAKKLVDEMVLVDTDEMCAAIKDVFEDTRVVLEPAGALAVAGAKAWVARHGARGKTLVAVACGANTNFDRLRFVAERAEVGEHREAVLAVTHPGEARQLPQVLPRAGRAQHHRVQLPHGGPARGAHLRRRHGARPRRDRAHREEPAARRLQHPGPVGRRNRQGPHAPHGRRPPAETEGQGQRAALPLRVSRSGAAR